ncbi:MAG TPA: hypothetical protein VFT66_05020 [Roseiflexaceae bacterium]|jgi:hypothetical protein|nr:hypothetical protein [Roseiflexaceae bacterium]
MTDRDDDMTENTAEIEGEAAALGSGDTGHMPKNHGVVSGLGGAGGSSGAGAVRAKGHQTGAVSGIDDVGDVENTSDTDELPNIGADAGATSGKHRNMLDDHGIPGKTRGSVSETMPAKTDPAKKRQD